MPASDGSVRRRRCASAMAGELRQRTAASVFGRRATPRQRASLRARFAHSFAKANRFLVHLRADVMTLINLSPNPLRNGAWRRAEAVETPKKRCVLPTAQLS